MKKIMLALLALMLGTAIGRAQVATFPVEWVFQQDDCGWTVVDNDGEEADNWNLYYDETNSLYCFYTRCSFNQMGAPALHYAADEWLISPAIEVTSDGLVFEYEMRNYQSHYQIYISYDNTVTDMLYDQPVVDSTVSNNSVTRKRSISLANYVGNTVYIGVRFLSTLTDYSWIKFVKAGIREVNLPQVNLPKDTIVDISDTMRIKAWLSEGSLNQLGYTWRSYVHSAEGEVMTSDFDSASFVYPFPCTDTIIVTATNSYGVSHDTMVVRAYDFQRATPPYQCNFDYSGNNGWVLFNGSNAWTVGSYEGYERSNLLYITEDEGASNSYSTDASVSYAVRAFYIAEAGEYQADYLWRCMGRGEYIDYLNLYITKDLNNLYANRSAYTSSWQNLTPGVLNLSGSAEWQRNSAVVTLDSGVVYVVVMWRNLGWSPVYGEAVNPPAAIDDFSLRRMTCSVPENLHITDATPSSVTIAWTAMSNETEWAYSLDGLNYTVMDHNPFTIDGTEPGTPYTITVRAICSAGDTSSMTSVSILTPCATIDELPWGEDFSTFTPSADVFDPCWRRGRSKQEIERPQVVSVDGDNAFYMECINQVGWVENAYSYVVLPPFADPIGNLNINFEMRRTAVNAAKVVVGIIDSLDYREGMNIDTVGAFEATSTTWQSFSASFAGHSANNAHIIIITDLSLNNQQQSKLYIDNIEVYDASSCLKPNHLSIDSVSETEAIISWQHPNAAVDQFEVSYRPANTDIEWNVETVYERHATLSFLDEGVLYEVSVRAVCAPGEFSNPTTSVFRTLCQTDDIAYSEDFEGEGIECWNVLVTNLYQNVAWHRSNTQAYSGEYSMSSASIYSFFAPIDEWLVSPAINVPSDADVNLSFTWYSLNPTMSNHEEPYLVLANTDAYNDKASYTDTLAYVVGDETWTKHTVRISQYAGQKIHIAFVHNVASNVGDNAIYIDSAAIMVDQIPVVAINGPTAANVGFATQFTATRIGGSTEELQYDWYSQMLENGQATAASDDEENALTLTYLEEGIDTIVATINNFYGTAYDTLIVNVRDIHAITLPYSTGFEADDDNENWIVANSPNTGWVIDDGVSNGGSQAMYISSDNGDNNEYALGAHYVYAYRGVEFPDDGEYTISFDWRANGLNTANYGLPHGAMRVYLMPANTIFTNGMDLNNNDAVIRLSYNEASNFYGNSDWQNYVANIEIEKGLYILVFQWYNVAGGACYNPAAAIDNLAIESLTCYSPIELKVAAVTGTEATIEWTAGGEEIEWEVTVGDAAPEVSYETSYTATGLTPRTPYTVTVRSICGEGDTSHPITLSFYTDCSAIEELPWSEDFSSFAPTSSGIDIECWQHLGGGRMTTTRQYVNGSDPNNDCSLRPIHTSNRDTLPNGVALPYFYIPTRYLEMTVYLMAEGASAGDIEFGYLTYTNDIASFETARVITPAEAPVGSFTRFTITFPEAEANERIVIRKRYSSLSEYWYIDDITIDTIAGSEPFNCYVPTNLRSSRVSNRIYRVEWNAGRNETKWMLMREHNGDTILNTINDTPIRVYNDIDEGETYNFRVKAICNSLAESEWSDVYSLTVTPDTTHDGISGVEAAQFSMQPNPATSSVTVDLTDLGSNIDVVIVDLNGRIVERNTNASGKWTVDLGSYARGTYFVRVTTAEGTSVRKLIVQ